MCCILILYSGAKLQGLAMVCLLNLMTVVMQDSVNSAVIRSDMLSDMKPTGVNHSDQNSTGVDHYFSLLEKKANQQSSTSSTSSSSKSYIAQATAGEYNQQKGSSEGSADAGVLPPITPVSVSWRTDLLQRISVHFPPTFRYIPLEFLLLDFHRS